MQKFGKSNIIPDMLEATEDEVYDTLQKWINSMNNTPTKRTGKTLDPSTVKCSIPRFPKNSIRSKVSRVVFTVVVWLMYDGYT